MNRADSESEAAAFRPLEGTRVLSFEAAASLPAGTRMLADLGADVVRIAERPASYPHHIRVFDSSLINKQSIRLDLKSDAGLALAKRLAAHADVVASNFRPPVMPRLGLSYEVLRELKPDLIVLQLSGYGTPGPWQDFPAYGPSVEAAGGMNAAMGERNEPPQRVGGGVFADTLGGRYAAMAIVAALLWRDQTGEGQWIDASMYEAIVSGVGDLVLEAAVTGRSPAKRGNRHDTWAPQGIYRCAGEDEWVAISVTSDAEWEALVSEVEDDRLGRAAFSSAEGRRAAHDEIDERIEAWARRRSKQQAAELLQSAGVPAGPVQKTSDLPVDPQYRARGFFQQVHHRQSLLGWQSHPHMTLPGRAIGHQRAPLSDHNPDGGTADAVLERWLGIDQREIDELRRVAAFGEAAQIMPEGVETSWFGGRSARSDADFAERLELEPPEGPA